MFQRRSSRTDFTGLSRSYTFMGGSTRPSAKTSVALGLKVPGMGPPTSDQWVQDTVKAMSFFW